MITKTNDVHKVVRSNISNTVIKEDVAYRIIKASILNKIIDVNTSSKVVSNKMVLTLDTARFKFFQIPTPTPDGIETIFTLSESYVAGTLTVYRDQLALQGNGVDFTETTPDSGIFTLTSAPLTGEVVWANYIK